MPLPLVRYKAILKDQAGTKVAEFDNWRKLEYSKRVGDIGDYVLELDANDPRVPLFELDGQLEVYRKDFANNLDWYIDFEGLHRAPVRRVSERGEFVFNSVGVGYNDLLARRVIGYKSGTVRAVKNAPADTVMIEYVEENCGPSATIANGRLYEGAIAGFFTQASDGNGATWSGDRSFELVLDVLKEISKFSSIDFDVVGAGDAIYAFRTYADQLGLDRTTLGLDTTTGLNAAGNAPVVFSVEGATIKDMMYSDDHLSEVNVVFVLGKGDGSTRTVIVRDNVAAITSSLINQREVARSASKNEFEYQLITFGDETLEAMKAVESIAFNPLQQSSTVYGRDFGIGDKITVRNEGVDYHKRIVALRNTIEAGVNENIALEFSDLP